MKEALNQPKQKPRAWLVEFENGDEELHFDEQSVGEIHTPLYTHPPQRPWVGLTDEEIDALHTSIKVRLMGTFDTKDIYRAVEQALKEKNT